VTPGHATPTAEDLNPFLQVTGLRLGKVDGKRVRGAIELDERQRHPWGLAHDGAATTAIETAAGHSAPFHQALLHQPDRTHQNRRPPGAPDAAGQRCSERRRVIRCAAEFQHGSFTPFR
jgi:hypothetical protein